MSPSRRRAFALAVLGLACCAAPRAAPAQATRGPERARLRSALGSLRDSARVRLLAPGVLVEDGRLLGLRDDSVLVADADARFSVGVDEIEGLSVLGSNWRSVGLQGGAVTLVAGAAVGFFLGYARCGNQLEGCDEHALRVALRWGFVFGAGGAAAGALVGSRLKRWRSVFP